MGSEDSFTLADYRFYAVLSCWMFYKEDFEEISLLGEGGCGKVFKVKNKVDGNVYCVKVVKLSRKNK